MPLFRVPVQIVPRHDIKDPQGEAVADALRSVGFPAVREVHVGRYITVHTDAASADAAAADVKKMCEKLLANPTTEDFVIGDAALTKASPEAQVKTQAVS